MPPELNLTINVTILDADARQLLASPGECSGYELIFIARGAGAFLIDLQHGPIGDNQVFVIHPGQKRRLVFDRCEEGYLFSFPSVLIDTGEPLNYSGQVLLSDETGIDLREVALRLVKEFHRPHPLQAELVKRYLGIFLLFLSRHFTGHAGTIQRSRESELVRQFLRLLNAHYREKKMVGEYAAELCITANYLNEIVKKNTGYPASFHIRQRIALEAKRMALYSDVSMKTIAYDLGYSDPCQFSKFFQTVTGKNFSAFKKETKISFALLPPGH